MMRDREYDDLLYFSPLLSYVHCVWRCHTGRETRSPRCLYRTYNISVRKSPLVIEHSRYKFSVVPQVKLVVVLVAQFFICS